MSSAPSSTSYITTANYQRLTNEEKFNVAVMDISSNDPSKIVRGLNILLRKTFDSNEINAIHLDIYPNLLKGLCDLLDVLNPLHDICYTPSGTESDLFSNLFLSSDFNSWPVEISSLYSESFKFRVLSLESNAMLMSILTIIRNLSLEAFNETAIAHATPIVKHLVSILVASTITPTISTIVHIAFDILINIGYKLDVTGQSRMSFFTFLDNVNQLPVHSNMNQFTMTKRQLYGKLSNPLSPISNVEYVYTISAMFPIMLQHILSPTCRPFTIRSLDLLAKLAQCNSNFRQIEMCPDGLYVALVQLLCLSHSITEPFVAEVSRLIGDPMGRYRPPICHTYSADNFFTPNDIVDTDIRDYALDAIYSMCSISYNVQLNFVNLTNLVEVLYSIILAWHGTVGQSTPHSTTYSSQLSNSSHNPSLGGNSFQMPTSGNNMISIIPIKSGEGHEKATSILQMMFNYPNPDISRKFETIQNSLTSLAAKDEHITDLLYNKALVNFQNFLEKKKDTFASDSSQKASNQVSITGLFVEQLQTNEF